MKLDLNRKACAYAVTINNYTFNDLIQLVELDFRYMCFGFEVGKDGTPHIQGYVYFQNKRYGSAVKKMLPRAHLEHAVMSPAVNRDYCSKQNEFYEFGVLPVKGKTTWDKIEEAMENPKEHVQMYMQYRKVYKEIKSKESIEHDEDRRFILVPEDMIYLKLNVYESDQVFMKYNSPLVNGLEAYEEEIIIVDYGFNYNNYISWAKGYPSKIKRGYEVVRIDPQIVYLVYRTTKELNTLLKEIDSYVDYENSVIL